LETRKKNGFVSWTPSLRATLFGRRGTGGIEPGAQGMETAQDLVQDVRLIGMGEHILFLGHLQRPGVVFPAMQDLDLLFP
jgi:hypothetical protein